MRIEPFAVDLREPLETAAGTLDRREGFLVRVEADGVEGVGEATPLPGWTEDHETCREALEAACDRFVADPSGALRTLEETPAARHGLKLALADQAARRTETPLYEHLGARRTVESVPVNAVIGDSDVDLTAARATESVEAGFEAIKVKIGARSVDADLERLRVVRETVGYEVIIRADANGAWTRGQADRAFDRLGDVRVSYVEQPLPADDLEGLAGLRGRGVGVAVDETLAACPLKEVLAAEAADAVVLKPMVHGGPRDTLQAATRARGHGVDPVITTTVDAVVARTTAVHVAAAIPHVHACGLATADRLATDLATDPAPITDGTIHVPQAPGHGVEVVSP